MSTKKDEKDNGAAPAKSPTDLLAEQQTAVNHQAEANAISIQKAQAAVGQVFGSVANPAPVAPSGEAKPEVMYAQVKFDHRNVSYQPGVEVKESSPATLQGLRDRGLVGPEKPEIKGRPSSPATAGETGSIDLQKAAAGDGKKSKEK